MADKLPNWNLGDFYSSIKDEQIELDIEKFKKFSSSFNDKYKGKLIAQSQKLENIIKALTSNPAKILKIDKGNLTIGNDADLCVVDINKPWIVKKEKLVSKSKNTSIEDKKLQGKVINTFVKGKELFKL